MVEFDRFIGIDWSGSQGYAQGEDGEFPIQVAVMDQDGLRLVEPEETHNPRWQTNRWSRTTVKDWLIRQVPECTNANARILVGLDFAFSFPHADLGCYFPGEASPTSDWLCLVDRIARITGQDFDPTPFVKDGFYAGFFKVPGHEGNAYQLRHRITERPKHLFDSNPASVFKLIGGDQVGRGSIAGIAFLRSLRSQLEGALHVWPFDGLDPGEAVKVVVVEVWPRILYERIGVPPNAHAYHKVFRLALQECGVSNVDAVPPPLGENTGDALMTAAALARLSTEYRWDTPERLAQNEFQYEGWIWGAE